MISTSTYSAFWAHLRDYGPSARVFYFVHLTDTLGNDFYFTDYDQQLGSYIPTKITTTPVKMVASIYDGIFSNSPVKVILSNIAFPQADSSSKRFSAEMLNKDFETTIGRVYLGFGDISDTADLFPLYKGRVANFTYGILSIEFELVDDSVVSLPTLPINRITRANFPYVSDDLIDAPIPLVYGRWNYEGTDNRYGILTAVPLFLQRSDLDDATPSLTFGISDLAIFGLNDLLLFDENLRAYGVVQDTNALIAGTKSMAVDLSTADDADYLQSTVYLYPDRVDSSVTNATNAVDHNYDTYAELDDGESITLFMPADITPLDGEELTALQGVYDETKARGLRDVQIELSGYSNETWSGGTLDIELTNSPFTDSLSAATINALFSTNTFNHTVSTALDVCHTRKLDGTTRDVWNMREADDASGTNETGNIAIVPSEGYYPTNEEIAKEAERATAEKTDAGTLTNAYSVTYDKSQNRMIVKRLSGSKYFKVFDIGVGSASEDYGFDDDYATVSWTNDSITSPEHTRLDVPDGDFSLVRIKITNNSGTTGEKFRLKGVRLTFTRAYRGYNFETRVVDRKNVSRLITTANLPSGEVKGYRIRHYLDVDDWNQSRSVLDNLESARFFITCSGRKKPSSGFFLKGPEIIQNILEDHIGVDSSLIDSTKFTAANTNVQTTELALYLAEAQDARTVLAQLARYSLGFFFVTQEGKYAVTVVKASYSPSDVNFTLYPRDIARPMNDNLKIRRISFKQVATDLVLNYCYDYAKDKYRRTYNATTTNNVSLGKRNDGTPYVIKDDDAQTIAEYFCGADNVYGLFGDLRPVIEFKSLNREWVFAELGDIVQADSSFDDVVDIFGQTFSSLYFMVVGKEGDRSYTKITMQYVGTTTPEGESIEYTHVGVDLL